MTWCIVTVLLTIHLLTYSTISTQETTTVSTPQPTTISTQETTTVSTQETTTVSTQETTTVSTQETTTVSTQETTTISTQQPTTISTQQPTTISTPQPTTISTQETTTVSTQQPTIISTQETTTVSTQQPTTISTPQPTTVSTPQPTTISTPQPTTISTQETTTVSTQQPTIISTQETTTVSTQQPTTISTQQPTTISTPQPTTVSTPQPTTISTPQPTTISTQETTTVSTQQPTTISTQETTTVSTQQPTTNSIQEISPVWSTPSNTSEVPIKSPNESNSQAPSSIRFICDDGVEAKDDVKCDGIVDCEDGSDEKNCNFEELCPARGLFACKDGKRCYSINDKCDGSKTCDDGSDEEYCLYISSPACQNNFFRCYNGKCVDEDLYCNGDFDCEDKSDEDGCIPKCSEGLFQCESMECIPQTQRCNLIPNCKDYSDERGCSPTNNNSCSEHEFPCRSGRGCIPMLSFCDGKNDCPDKSDEMNCLNSTIDNISEIIKEYVTIEEKLKRIKKINWFRDANAKWITELFEQVQNSFKMDSWVNENCSFDYCSYRLHLANQTAWAVKMMESSEWPSVGLLEGKMNNFGFYDQCLSISSHGIEGRYCLADVIWTNYPYDSIPDGNAVEHILDEQSAWKTITKFRNNPAGADKQVIKLALCIPSSCQANDLAKSLENALSPVFKKHKLDVSVHVSHTSCKTKDDQYSFSLGFYIISLLILIILLLVILFTYLDVTSDHSGKLDNNEYCKLSLMVVCKSFSIVENFQKLKNNNENDYAFVYFAKVLILVLVIYWHRFIHSTAFAEFNAEAFQEAWKWSKAEVMYEDMISVSFMICGFLMFFLNITAIKRGGCVFLLINVFSRWMKITSIICILVLYITCILPYTSDGPLWNNTVANEVSKCIDHWWAIPLAVSNWLIKSDGLCALVSWYAAVNIQLTILGGILLLIYCNYEKIGLHAFILTFLSSMLITFIKFFHQYPEILSTNTNSLEYVTIQQELSNFYTATYTRVGPYLVGFISALVTKLVNENNNLKHHLSKKPIFALWTFGIVFIEILLKKSPISIAFRQDYSRLENAVYASVHQSLFASVWAVLFFKYFTSDMGIMQKFFNSKMFVPLGRLTYSVYLSNIIVYFYYTYSQRRFTWTQSRVNLVWLFFGDIICSYVIGLFVHLLIEAPIANILRLIRKGVIDKRPGDSRPFNYNDGSTNNTNASIQSLTSCAYSVDEIAYCDTTSCDS